MTGWSVKPGAVRVAALLVVVLAASACSEKKVVVDPNDGLEGVASPSQLVVWNETPTVVETYADTLTPGPNPDLEPPDRLLGSEEVYLLGPGNIHGMIFDYTRASRFDIFRDAGNGFRTFKDFQLDAQRRYLFSHTDLFRFTDPLPVALQRYMGRGVVSGVTTPLSPKTNVGRVSLSAVAGDLQFTAPTGIPPDFRQPPPDSLLFMSWNAYPGAAGYWVHVYQFTTQGGQEIILSGVPAPFYFADTRDYFLAYFPATVTSYRMGLKPDGTPIGPVPPGARIVEEQHLINNQFYNVRVSAVNDQGELIAYTGSAGSHLIFRQETTYRRFPLGGVVMNTRRILPPSPTEPMRISAAAPGVWYVPPRQLNRPR